MHEPRHTHPPCTTRRGPNCRFGAPDRQAGTALFVSLISLVIMTLGAFALVRAIDTSSVIAGNVGFKQASMMSSDAGIEAAVTWVQNNKGLLTADSSGDGYYATAQTNLDIMGNKQLPNDPTDDVDWDGSNPATTTKAKPLPTDATDNTVAFVINRLCTFPGSTNDPNQSCMLFQPSGNAPTSSHGGVSYSGGSPPQGTSQQAYYRVTARVLGPRNTVTYVQAVILI
jgi:Tfp pilus assembly protein PilX